MKFYGNNRQMEYDIIVKPGVDPSIVQLSYEGIEGLSVTNDGRMEIALKEGKVIQNKPYCYQEIDGKRVEVEGSFKLLNPQAHNSLPCRQAGELSTPNSQLYAYSFDVPSYNKKHPLIIDPVLEYSTYLGGSDGDRGYAIDVDSVGNAYVASIAGNAFPLQGSIQSLNGRFDVGVTKLSVDGSTIIYSTYIGGSGNYDEALSMKVDNAGNAYITGRTRSTDFPTTPGALQVAHAPIAGSDSVSDFDAFVTKLDASGNTLVYSTYLGGSEGDAAQGIALDSVGNAYITGATESTDFPTVNPYQSAFAGGFVLNQLYGDAFVTKLNATGSAIVYSTYLGGNAGDIAYGIVLDSVGNAYITGITLGSTNFPTTPGSFQENRPGGIDGFITKLNTDGSNLVYSTYLGGWGGSWCNSIDVDSSGNAYVVGYTDRPVLTNFPLKNDLGFSAVDTNASFAVRLNAAGSDLVYSTILEGGGAVSVALDANGNAFISGGVTINNLLTTVDPIQSTLGGGSDLYLMKLSADVQPTLLFSSYLGGSGTDGQFTTDTIALDSAGNIYVTGLTTSSDFPTTIGAFQTTFAGGTDAFVAKISFGAPPIVEAGINLTIDSSEQLSTTLNGTVSDPNDDPLTYRWLEGAAELLASTSVVAGSAPLDMSSLAPLSIGAHTLTLEANDGQATATDDMILTIENSPPTVAPSGGGTFQLGDNITLSGSVADFDGDGLDYRWFEGTSPDFIASFIGTTAGGAPVALPDFTIIGGLPLGNHVITLEGDDVANSPVSADININVVDTTAPAISATVDPGILWPPNHKMVDVVVQANANDNSGSVTLSATVASSEPPDTDGDGNTIPDFTEPVIDQSTGEITLQLRSERKGQGTGRTYTITVTATDDSGNSSGAVVEVVAPHDKGKK